MKRLLTFLCLLFLIGCQGAHPMSLEDQLAKMEAISKFARENDMALSINISLTGRGGVYASQNFGLETGVIAQATLIANSGDADPQ